MNVDYDRVVKAVKRSTDGPMVDACMGLAISSVNLKFEPCRSTISNFLFEMTNAAHACEITFYDLVQTTVVLIPKSPEFYVNKILDGVRNFMEIIRGYEFQGKPYDRERLMAFMSEIYVHFIALLRELETDLGTVIEDSAKLIQHQYGPEVVGPYIKEEE